MSVSENDLISVSGNDAEISGGMDYDVVYQAVYDANVDALALQEVTEGQSVNSTALTYFTGILENQAFPVDYVIYVGESYTYSSGYGTSTGYEYCMAYGDLTCTGTHFTGDDCTLITMRTPSGQQSVTYDEGVSVDLTAPMYYARSNLGTYSGVIQYPWMEYILAFMVFTGGLIWLLRKVMQLIY